MTQTRSYEVRYSVDRHGIERAAFLVDGQIRQSAYSLNAMRNFARGYTGNGETPVTRVDAQEAR